MGESYRAFPPRRSRPTGAALAAVAFLLGVVVPASVGAVVINEIHYDPPVPAGRSLEFVELHNESAEEVDLTGWRFKEGIDYRFPDGTRIAPGGFLVVVRDRSEFLGAFRVDAALVLGNFLGSLDNGGEELVLVDGSDALIDAVRYDDRAPWPTDPDGDGASLQRLCPEGLSESAENWTGLPGDLPTPLAHSVRTVCPPPSRPAAPVVVSEIHYHPTSDRDDLEEYVELHNRTGERVELSGWRLDLDGEDFLFDVGAGIDAGGYLAVCRSAAHIRETFGIQNAIGDFLEPLPNGDGRIALHDDADRLIDVAVYRDGGQWPWQADSGGSSLERIVLESPGDDPANWAASSFASGDGGFVHVETIGPPGPITFQRIVVGLDGRGEFVVDNIRIRSVEDDSVDLLIDFESPEDDAAWSFLGNSAGSTIEAGIGVGGSRGLRLVSIGECASFRCAVIESVSLRLGRFKDTLTYRFALDFMRVSGSDKLDAGLLGGVQADVASRLLSPGSAGTRVRDEVPPFFAHRGRFPAAPRSGERVWLSVHARAAGGGERDASSIGDVTLTYRWGDIEETQPMFDDGLHRDGLAGDGTYGCDLPAFPDQSTVFYRFAARSESGVVGYSPRASAEVPSDDDWWAFHVSDDQPDSPLPVYHLLLPGLDPTDPTAINEYFDRGTPGDGCKFFRSGAFVFRGEVYPDIGVRFRGNTACFVKKRNLKLNFNRGRFFQGQNKLNLQALWTDKALVREHLAWDFMRQLGAPYSHTEFVRLHVNGAYHGLFLCLEHPDRSFLDRNGLDDEGRLFKAIQLRTEQSEGLGVGLAARNGVDGYDELWEQENREDGDFSEIEQFIESLHADGTRAGGPSVDFMSSNVDHELMITFQAGMVALNNLDSATKNHFLYRNPGDGRWGLITWDLDLVFGAYFDFLLPAQQGLVVGTLNDCMRSPTEVLRPAPLTTNELIRRDVNPWLHTSIRGNFMMNYLIDFFLRAGNGHYQRSYLIRLWDIMTEKYTSEALEAQLDELQELLLEEADEDLLRWGRYKPTEGCRDPDANSERMEVQIEVMKRQIRFHRQYILDYITTFEGPPVSDHDRMKITEMLYDAPGRRGEEEAEYIELLNTSGRRIDISGWRLTGGVEFEFPRGSIVENGEVIVVVRSRVDFESTFPDVAGRAQIFGDYDGRLDNDGEEVRLIDAGPGHPATIDRLRWSDGHPWPEVLDGFSIELTGIGPARDNDRAEHWISSAVPGGSPGELPLMFVRGDANSDQAINLTDPIFILDYLFRGGVTPPCLDAADVNDDGLVQLTDAVVLLGFLFRGQEPPAQPFPEPGVDPTGDEVSCLGTR